MDGKEVIRAGRYYGPGRTTNEAESFAIQDALQCLSKLVQERLSLRRPVQVFGDSQLMIRFLTRVFKRPSHQSIYWAIEDARVKEWALGQPVAYCHVTRDANCVPDDMARQALEARETIIFWDGEVPDDAPGNQLQDVYEQQGVKPRLDWADLPEPFDWKNDQPNPQPDVTVASIFWHRYAVRVAQF